MFRAANVHYEVAERSVGTAYGGISLIDTSPDYGRSEELIGRYLGHRRGEYFLASKCGCLLGDPPPGATPPFPHDYSPGNVRAGVEQSLRRLGTDRVDLMQVHMSPGRAQMEADDTVETLLGLRDEFLALGLGDGARKLADNALTLAEFLAREMEAGRLKLPLQPLPNKRALLHGHCHEKAFAALDPVKTVLGLIPQLEIQVIESSCCGMAGSFGYDARHHAISMQMAELSLLPAVRAAASDALVVANGTSCRHQIRDGIRGAAAQSPEHLARILERALQTPYSE